MNKKMTAIGLTAGLVAGAGAGFVLEMSGSAGAASSSAAVVAPIDDDSIETSRPDPGQRLQEILKPLVDDNTITQAQADAVVEALQAAGPKGDKQGRPGKGLAVVAEALGLTEAEVKDAISNGQTLAQLAEANGSSAEELVEAMLADIKSHVDEKVAAGEITQEQADERLAKAEEHITEFVNNTPEPGSRRPGGRPGRPGGPGGPGGVDAPVDAGS